MVEEHRQQEARWGRAAMRHTLVRGTGICGTASLRTRLAVQGAVVVGKVAAADLQSEPVPDQKGVCHVCKVEKVLFGLARHDPDLIRRAVSITRANDALCHACSRSIG